MSPADARGWARRRLGDLGPQEADQRPDPHPHDEEQNDTDSGPPFVPGYLLVHGAQVKPSGGPEPGGTGGAEEAAARWEEGRRAGP